MGDVKLCMDCPTVLIATATWCGHCINFKPEINKLVKLYDGKNIHVVLLDADKDEGTLKLLKINSYPTVRIYNPFQRQFVEYSGDRSAVAIHTFTTSLPGVAVAHPQPTWITTSRVTYGM